MALARSEGHYDLTAHSVEQTVEIIREALSGHDTDRIRGQMKHVLMMSDAGQHKFVEGFTDLVMEVLHEGNYSDVLLFIGILGEHQLTSGNYGSSRTLQKY